MTAARDRGQSTVELALGLPFVCLLLLAVVQVAVIARDRLAVQLAAREGARAASVSTDRGAAAAAARRAVALQPLTVEVHEGDHVVTVTVGYQDRTDVPLVGMLLPDVHVTATVAMSVEPP